jgi:hypothetical protein
MLTGQPLTVTLDVWRWLMFMGWLSGLAPNGAEGMMDEVLQDIARQLSPALEGVTPG